MNETPASRQRLIRLFLFVFFGFVIATLPTAVFCKLISMYASIPHVGAAEISTPNPTKAPAGALGPIDILAYSNPWFAGVAFFWVVPGLLLVVAAVLFASYRMAFIPSAERRTKHPLLDFLLVVYGVGLAFAIPWFIGTIRLITVE